jgi:hypothetical protein
MANVTQAHLHGQRQHALTIARNTMTACSCPDCKEGLSALDQWQQGTNTGEPSSTDKKPHPHLVAPGDEGYQGGTQKTSIPDILRMFPSAAEMVTRRS